MPSKTALDESRGSGNLCNVNSWGRDFSDFRVEGLNVDSAES
jgi:hypothetical protein